MTDELPEGYISSCEKCDAKPLNGVCDCPESLNAEIKRLKSIKAELLAALSELHDFAEVSTHYRHQQRSESAFDNAANLIIKHDAAAIANAQPHCNCDAFGIFYNKGAPVHYDSCPLSTYNAANAKPQGEYIMREEYTMTQEQQKTLLDACRPVPYMVIGGIAPRSPQENANAAWCRLGKEMGFDGMSVEPVSGQPLKFTAIATAAIANAQPQGE